MLPHAQNGLKEAGYAVTMLLEDPLVIQFDDFLSPAEGMRAFSPHLHGLSRSPPPPHTGQRCKPHARPSHPPLSWPYYAPSFYNAGL